MEMTHGCLIHKTFREQFDAAVPFIKGGLERQERSLYIHGDNSADAVKDELMAAGVNVFDYQDVGSLRVLAPEASILRAGRFEPRAAIFYLKEAYEQARADGFEALRVAVEMSCAAEVGPEELSAYEQLLAEAFQGKPVSLLCQYNGARFLESCLRRAVLAHPFVCMERTFLANGCDAKSDAAKDLSALLLKIEASALERYDMAALAE